VKSIVLGDLHLGVKDSSDTYHNMAILLSNQIIKYAVDHSIGTLIQVGDLFDNRKAISHDTIDVSHDIITRFNNFFDMTYLIVGNHDTAKKDTMFPHSLVMFKEYGNVCIVDKPTREENILMLPWIFDMNDMKDAEICIGHFDINGALMNSAGTVSKNHNLNFSDFSKYKMAISGHYHTPKTYINNVWYVGSPYQLTHNDAGSKRGFWILDTDFDDGKLEFVEFKDYPHHFSFTDKNINIDNIPGNIIRFTFTESLGIDGDKRVINSIRELNPYSLTVKFANISDSMTDEEVSEVVMIKDKLNILYDFYEKSALPESISLEMLKKIANSIYKEIKGNG
jgi:DNA repair exonuclease SbcCD nuclease subunit